MLLVFLALAVPTLLFLLAMVVFLLFPGLSRAARPRARRAGVPTGPARQRPPSLSATEVDGAAVLALLQTPPAGGDTCDRCSMQAAAAVYLPGGRLLLCGHHGRQHQSALRTHGAVIVGELSFPDRSPTAA